MFRQVRFLSLFALVVLLLAGCQMVTPTPVVMEVTREVPVTVEVPKEIEVVVTALRDIVVLAQSEDAVIVGARVVVVAFFTFPAGALVLRTNPG